MLRILFVGLPTLLFWSGIPCVLKLVPPNRFSGFRKSTAFWSLDAWYQINFAMGLALIEAGDGGGLAALAVELWADRVETGISVSPRHIVSALVMFPFLIPVVIYADRF
jgi:hypothetical protein